MRLTFDIRNRTETQLNIIFDKRKHSVSLIILNFSLIISDNGQSVSILTVVSFSLRYCESDNAIMVPFLIDVLVDELELCIGYSPPMTNGGPPFPP